MILRAAHLICDSKKVITDGCVRISGGKIAAVDKALSIKRAADEPEIDLGEVVIAPGFVNAHTHLSFRERIPFAGNFGEWLISAGGRVRALSPDECAKSLEASLAEAISTGTTTIASNGIPPECPINAFYFVELICLSEGEVERKIAEMRERLAAIDARGKKGGVAPHSPFTVAESLLKYCAQISEKEDRFLSIHAAETAAESALLKGHRGELYEMLRNAPLCGAEREFPGSTPVKYLASLGLVSRRALLVHCNYLTTEEVDIISRAGASVVYCPRSSDFFGHTDHPFMRLTDRGINVALGTDSLASVESLSTLDEVKFLARKSRRTPPSAFWKLATENGAAALGLKNRTGRLKEGMSADIVIINVAGCAGRDAFERAAAQESRVAATIAAGRVVHDAGGIFAEHQRRNNA